MGRLIHYMQYDYRQDAYSKEDLCGVRWEDIEKLVGL